VKLPVLSLWRDPEYRSAAANMALDEALFLWSCATGLAVARFYHWDHAAVTVGYFNQEGADGHHAVRRFTGGGLVEHGEDLTFLLTFPAGSAMALAPGKERYRHLHTSLAEALASTGFPLRLAAEQESTSGGPCFAHPVPWDLLTPEGLKKIGGGAQRRSRGAVIHQGSIRLPEALRNPMADWIGGFLSKIAGRIDAFGPDEREICYKESLRLATDRYASSGWNGSSGEGLENRRVTARKLW